MNTRKIIGLLLLGVFCTVCFTGNAQQVIHDKMNVALIVECDNPYLKILIENIVSRELGKLTDVNLMVETPGRFILNIIAVESGCNACSRVSITSLFLTRQEPSLHFMIREDYLKAYETFNNVVPSFDLPKVQTGYCSRDRLEEYFIGVAAVFNEQVLENERRAKQLRSEIPKIFHDTFQEFRKLEEALEKNR